VDEHVAKTIRSAGRSEPGGFATPEPETIVQTVEVEKEVTVVETVEVEKTVVETVEVEKEVVVEVTPVPEEEQIVLRFAKATRLTLYS